MRFPRRITTWLIVVWTGLAVWLYVETLKANCGNENDCGAAVGLGLLLAGMIWAVGMAVLLLARFIGGRISRRRRQKAADPETGAGIT